MSPIFRLLTSALFFAATVNASAIVLLIRPLENHSAATETEVQQMNEVFQNRIKTLKGWTFTDSTQAGPCDLDCQVALAEKEGANIILSGSIDPVPNTGNIQITANLIDPATRKRIQTETTIVGPEVEKDFGKISALAKLFDPASLAQDSGQEIAPAQDKTGTAAGWILGGAALMVLVVVLYSLL